MGAAFLCLSFSSIVGAAEPTGQPARTFGGTPANTTPSQLPLTNVKRIDEAIEALRNGDSDANMRARLTLEYMRVRSSDALYLIAVENVRKTNYLSLGDGYAAVKLMHLYPSGNIERFLHANIDVEDGRLVGTGVVFSTMDITPGVPG